MNTRPPNSHLLFPTSHPTLYIPNSMSRAFNLICCYFSRMTSSVSSQGTITVICSAYVEYLLNFLKAQLTNETVLSISPHYFYVLVRYLDRKETGFGLPSYTCVITTNPVSPISEEYTLNAPPGSPWTNLICWNVTSVNLLAAYLHSDVHYPALPPLSNPSNGVTKRLYSGINGEAHKSFPKFFYRPFKLRGGAGSSHFLRNFSANWYSPYIS